MVYHQNKLVSSLQANEMSKEPNEQKILSNYRILCENGNPSFFQNGLICTIARKWLFCDSIPLKFPKLAKVFAKPMARFEQIFEGEPAGATIPIEDFEEYLEIPAKDLEDLPPDHREAVLRLRFAPLMITIRNLSEFVLHVIQPEIEPGSEWPRLKHNIQHSESVGVDSSWLPVAKRIVFDVLFRCVRFQQKGADELTDWDELCFGPIGEATYVPATEGPEDPRALFTGGCTSAIPYLAALKATEYANRCLNAITALRCPFFIDQNLECPTAKVHHVFKELVNPECISAVLVGPRKSMICRFVIFYMGRYLGCQMGHFLMERGAGDHPVEELGENDEMIGKPGKGASGSASAGKSSKKQLPNKFKMTSEQLNKVKQFSAEIDLALIGRLVQGDPGAGDFVLHEGVEYPGRPTFFDRAKRFVLLCFSFGLYIICRPLMFLQVHFLRN